MKVFYIKNDDGVYGNARYFTKTGVPKLYGTRKRAQYQIDDAIKFQARLSHVSSRYPYGLAVAHVVEGELE